VLLKEKKIVDVVLVVIVGSRECDYDEGGV
jgi:hypothetical protein